MKKGKGALVWAAVFCLLIAAPAFAAEEKQGTTDSAEWQKKLDEIKKKREQKLEQLNKDKAATDTQAVQKKEEGEGYVDERVKKVEGVKQEERAADKQSMEQMQDERRQKLQEIKDLKEQSREEQKQKLDEMQDLKAKSREEQKQKLDELKDIKREKE